MNDQPTFKTTIYDMITVNGRISKKLFQKLIEPKLEKLAKLEKKVFEQQLKISNDAIDRLNDDRDITIGVLEFVNKNLKEENQQLRQIIAETLPLARRYADNRSTYVPSLVNEAIDKALELNIDLIMGNDSQYARDGMLGDWNPKTKKFEKE